MCKPVQCAVCSKTTWEGCGEHIEDVRAQVAAEDWCPGHAEAKQAHGCGCGHKSENGLGATISVR